jgi:hypothetical protein
MEGERRIFLIIGRISGLPKGEPEEVTVLSRYLAPGAQPDEWVVERADGQTMTVQGQDLHPLKP